LRVAEKGRLSVPFAARPLFFFPLDMQVNRAANNHQAKRDGQNRFQIRQIHLLCVKAIMLYRPKKKEFLTFFPGFFSAAGSGRFSFVRNNGLAADIPSPD